MNYPAMEIILKENSFEFDSLDDPESLEASGCEYADLLLLEEILSATVLNDRYRIIQSTNILNRFRDYTKNDKIGLISVPLFEKDCLLIVDENRELVIKES